MNRQSVPVSIFKFGRVVMSCGFCLVMAATAHATVIASVPESATSGGLLIGNDFGADESLFVTWTASAGYTGVLIDAWLFNSDLGSGQGTAYLTTQVGPGSTVATEVDSTTFTFAPLSSASATILFTGLSLGPGTYYLVIASTSASGDYWQSGTTPFVTASGVTIGAAEVTGEFGGATQVPDDAYPPGSTWATYACCHDYAFDVVSNAPEPSTFGTTMAAFAFLPVFLLSRRRSPRQSPSA